ncbi:hypothetical protein SynA1528_00094 [Synechococcus sp. A15-28]|nr:hypothetical protein SynA1528_00094 [Synechococcus sp. A15-28]
MIDQSDIDQAWLMLIVKGVFELHVPQFLDKGIFSDDEE